MGNQTNNPQHQQSLGQQKAQPGQQHRQGERQDAGGQGGQQRQPGQGERR